MIVFKEIHYSCTKAKFNTVTSYVGCSICCCKSAPVAECCILWQNMDAEGGEVLGCCLPVASPHQRGVNFQETLEPSSALSTSAEPGSAARWTSPRGEAACCWDASGLWPPFRAALWDLATCSESRFSSKLWDLPSNGCCWSR